MNPIEQFERERDERIKSFEHNQSLRKAAADFNYESNNTRLNH